MKSLSKMMIERERYRKQGRALLYFFLIYLAVAVLFAMTSDAQEIEIREVAIKHARANGLDPSLVLAVIEVESNFNPNAVGSTHGEIGLMQLHPRFFPGATFSVEENIRLGVEYLARLKRLKAATQGCGWFVSYNTGPNAEIKYPTRHPYYRKVSSVYPNYCQSLKLAGN